MVGAICGVVWATKQILNVVQLVEASLRLAETDALKGNIGQGPSSSTATEEKKTPKKGASEGKAAKGAKATKAKNSDSDLRKSPRKRSAADS